MKRLLWSSALVGGALLGGVPARGAEPARPTGVAPGAGERFQLAAPCPVFTWTAGEAPGGYELVVYRAAATEEGPALTAVLPPGATAWTPPADQCLAAGLRYAWSVRARTEGASTGWSEALLFEIAETPSAAELDAAIAGLERFLGTARVGEPTLGRAEANLLRTRAVAATESPESQAEGKEARAAPAGGEGAGVRAISGEVPDATGETYGVEGIVHSPDGAALRAENTDAAGADLLLAGAPGAELTELGLARDSASNLTFDFSNPGAGTMSVAVDGVPVVTTATDQDTLAGLLPCNDDDVAKVAGGVWTCALDAGGVTYTAGNQIDLTGNAISVLEGSGSGLDADLLDGLNSTTFAFASHTHGIATANTKVGDSALAANTTGFNNTALGEEALLANTGGSYNTAVGTDSLRANTASGNTGVGYAALRSNTTGVANTAVGLHALRSNTTGERNTSLGDTALATNTTGSYETAVGWRALAANATGIQNTAVGARALDANSTGSFNVAVGFRALAANTAGGANTAIGSTSLKANTTGSSNTATGRGALYLNTTGDGNTATGSGALSANTTGYRLTATGFGALQSNTTGHRGTATGVGALGRNTTGSNGVAMGYWALYHNETGNGNTAVGHLAMRENVVGHRNAALGYRAGYFATGSNNIMIGNEGIAAESGRIRLGTAGTHTATYVAGIRGVTTGVADAVAVMIDSAGQLGTVSSSRRFKEDIQDLGPASGTLLDLRPVSFRYKREAGGPPRPREYGLIAEEVAEVFPELVVFDADGRPETVKYHLLVPLLLNELQALERRVAELEGREQPPPEPVATAP
jgi:hypothetical protein